MPDAAALTGVLTGAVADRLAAPLAASNSNGSPIAGYILPVLLVFGFYFLLIRPQRARARRAQQLVADLQVGQEVMTTAGMFGTIRAIDDAEVVLEVAPGFTTRWAKGAIARVVPPPRTDLDAVTGADDAPAAPADGEPPAAGQDDEPGPGEPRPGG